MTIAGCQLLRPDLPNLNVSTVIDLDEGIVFGSGPVARLQENGTGKFT